MHIEKNGSEERLNNAYEQVTNLDKKRHKYHLKSR